MGELLYHYTSIEALASIVKSGSLRTTRADFVNDPHEWKQGLSVMNAVITALLEDTPEVTEDEVRGIRSIEARINDSAPLPRIYSQAPFIACFCKDGDDPVLWRLYAPEGVSIGIDKGAIGKLGTVRVCTYGEADLKPEIRRYLLEGARVIVKYPGSQINHDNIYATSILTILLPFYKSKLFKHESETRLAVFPRNDDLAPTFVASRGQLRPHRDLPLDVKSIQHIVVGPGRHQLRNEEAVRMLLAGVRVTRSDFEINY